MGQRPVTPQGRTLAWLDHLGVVRCGDPQQMEKLKGVLVEVFAALPDLLPQLVDRGLDTFYLYRQQDQEGGDRLNDGVCCFDHQEDGGVLFAVGVAVEAMDKGADYAVLVVLHECVHIIKGGEHNQEFHAVLSELLRRFHSVTGRLIINDKYGLPVRHDSIPWTPPPIPEDFRGDQQDGRRVFRSGGKPV